MLDCPELSERAVWLLQEQRDEYKSAHTEINSIAKNSYKGKPFSAGITK